MRARDVREQIEGMKNENAKIAGERMIEESYFNEDVKQVLLV
jgi:hypothetical protein